MTSTWNNTLTFLDRLIFLLLVLSSSQDTTTSDPTMGPRGDMRLYANVVCMSCSFLQFACLRSKNFVFDCYNGWRIIVLSFEERCLFLTFLFPRSASRSEAEASQINKRRRLGLCVRHRLILMAFFRFESPRECLLQPPIFWLEFRLSERLGWGVRGGRRWRKKGREVRCL